jgi:lipopolysaccharide transport system permease protein
MAAALCADQPRQEGTSVSDQIPIRIYSAESQVLNIRAVLREMVRGLIHARYVAYRLARRQIKNQYAASALGLFWDLVDPLIMAGIFYYLMRTRIISDANLGMPPSVFVVYGIMLYLIYTEALTLSTQLLSSSTGLLSQLRVPPESLIVSVFFRVCFNSIFRILVMLFFSLLAGAFSLPGFLVFLAFMPVFILAGMAPGIFLSPFNTIYNDVGRVIRLLIFPMRFLTPVIYAIPSDSVLGKLQIINPVTQVLVNMRSIAVTGQPVNIAVTLIHLSVILAIGLTGWFLFHIAVPVLSERT